MPAKSDWVWNVVQSSGCLAWRILRQSRSSGSELGLPLLEGPLVQGDGFGGAASYLVRQGQIVAGGERVVMIRSEHGLKQRQGPLVLAARRHGFA